MPDEVVVSWGNKIGTHGADVISVNMKTGEVTLWDAKYRGSPRTIQPSETFQKGASRDNAIKQATDAIQENETLPPDVKGAALKKLLNREVRTRTTGEGQARNSLLK